VPPPESHPECREQASLEGLNLCENLNLRQSDYQHTRHSVANQRSVYIFMFAYLEFLKIAKEG
jgi:hypothetical protein